LKGVRVRAWQGIPDITVDNESQIEVLAAAPWGEDVDLSDNVVEVELHDLTTGASRVGISTTGTIVSIREDSGIISRCNKCRRVLRDGECSLSTCESYEGVDDVRLRMVMDNGKSTISLILNKAASESLIGMDMDKISSFIAENGSMQFVQNIREMLLGRELKADGRTIVDEQGAMLLSDNASVVEVDSVLVATELRAKWGVQ